MSKRTYRIEVSAELSRIEAKRLELKISHEDLYIAAGIARSTYYGMRASGLAFQSKLQALRYGLRTAEQRLRNAERLFDGSEA
ncbi:hypothetical protein [Rhizobium straminoryzae]|uniref:Uncharacterized protein n=1 Tax=Rhizobium straminoryzae TaxID=1387186 RepID=A0A549TCZ0_9HYPH|nr:hypothetical protein [Rhizobium straminoryzae]TRL39845.1 hypothetical protein FNA46_07880 [Rhizobium straminoryzae]